MRIPLSCRTRWELIATITAPTVNTRYELPSQGGNLPMDRFIHALQIRARFRVTMPASGMPSATNIDAPFSMINRVVVSGFHKLRGTREEIINLRGADLYNLSMLYCSVGGFTTHTSATISRTASATNDIDFTLYLPFTPLKMPAFKGDEYALDAPNYDNLKLEIFWADEPNLFTVGGSACTFSAFGMVGGAPRITVSGQFYQAGLSLFRGFVPARVYRYFSEVTGSLMTTTSTGVRLFNLPRGHRLRSIMLKAGVKAATSSGNDAFLSTSDTALGNIKVFRGLNKSIRDYMDVRDIQQEIISRYAIRAPIGHGLIDFVPFGMDEEVLDLRGLVAGATGDVDCFIQADVAGAASQGAVAVWEEWRHAYQLGGR